MPKGIKKENLPYKICVVCNKPFSWRKKWENNWEDVKYCSERCRRHNYYSEVKRESLRILKRHTLSDRNRMLNNE